MNPRCSQFWRWLRRKRNGCNRCNTVRASHAGQALKAAATPEGESALGRLAALFAPYRPAAGNARRSRLAIQLQALSRGMAEYFNRLPDTEINIPRAYGRNERSWFAEAEKAAGR